MSEAAETAGTPSIWGLPSERWKKAFVRAYEETGNDNVGIVAAGVGFYGFLSLVPLLASAVLIYGLVVEPETVENHVAAMAQTLPASAADLIRHQLHAIVTDSGSSQGIGLVIALALALFSARSAAAAVIVALNIAYDREDTRSFVRRTLLALAITLGGIIGAGFALGGTTAVAALGTLIPGAGEFAWLYRLASYLVLLLVGMAAAATLYRYAPDRAEPRWTWITPGSAFTAAGWLLVTIGFSIYVANFGNYDATYGSLGAVVVLLTWMWLSAYVLLFGAELNSAIRDTGR